MYCDTVRAYRVLHCGTDHYAQQKSSAPGKTEDKKKVDFFYILAELKQPKSFRNNKK
jgi:hypothetical protein